MTALLSILVLASTFATSSGPSAPALCSGASMPAEQSQIGGGSVPPAYCYLDCGSSGPPITCTGITCSAVDRSCPWDPGHITCDGITYYCPPCCTEGATKVENAGPVCSCEDGLSTPKDRYKCVNGEWEYQFSFCGAPFCQG